MTVITDYERCRRCGYERADYEFDCSTSEESIDCGRCGHSAALQRMQEADGKVSWIQSVTEGAGALGYQVPGGAFVVRYLSSDEDVREAEQWLRKKLAAGDVDRKSAYLTRWNAETRSVESIVGTYRELLRHDPK